MTGPPLNTQIRDLQRSDLSVRIGRTWAAKNAALKLLPAQINSSGKFSL